MCKHDDGCNVPEGECSGACMKQGETLDQLCERFPAVKALREELELERQSRDADAIFAETQRDIIYAQAQKIATLESQLAGLRQGGEAVGVLVESDGEGEGGIYVEWFDLGMPVGTKLYTRPQPAIQPGYVVPDDLVAWLKDEAVRKTLVSHPRKFKFAAERGMSSLDEVHGWMTQVSKQGESIFAKYGSAPAIQPQAAGSIAENGQLLGTEHKGMRVDYTGMFGQAIKGLKGNPGIGFMLSELERNISEVGDRYYSGDIKAVDEFLQLYCVARDKRAMLAAPADSEEGK